jgi:nitrate reductase NapAB chaperone NapD
MISGVLVVCRPEHVPELRDRLSTRPWAEIHHTEPDGRLVVTIDAADTGEAMERLEEVQRLPHVITAQLAEYYVGDD